eukprot:643326-Hanusia_phi.AAC.1
MTVEQAVSATKEVQNSELGKRQRRILTVTAAVPQADSAADRWVSGPGGGGPAAPSRSLVSGGPGGT